MNILCMGGRVIDSEKALQLSIAFLEAKFSNKERFKRRLMKIEKRTRELWAMEGKD